MLDLLGTAGLTSAHVVFGRVNKEAAFLIHKAVKVLRALAVFALPQIIVYRKLVLTSKIC